METIIIQAKTKKPAEEVRRKLRTITGLQIETWKELDQSLPNVAIPEKLCLK